MMDMMESMMKDPNMRDYMLSSLPEGMRNPEMLDMMFKNPMMREQMKSMLANPDAMKEMMQNGMPDMSTMPNMQNIANAVCWRTTWHAGYLKIRIVRATQPARVPLGLHWRRGPSRGSSRRGASFAAPSPARLC